ncbi:UDP-N-acetylglucosamine 2-epimerase (hydrolyzing) [Paramagnetospirillum kuznetsovii]|uniref:UDP-N-acetylglucosamine 2-epimerase (Hydrolyzing) n=1 Tax=Paramagnetospirillum kuznetsovii TaxID=2053833 RepID=A0A364P2N1_9PROT|nr:UDP-N-acetylglucosamine 2-epimerase [Paramagnetospirillum kuznetsovii]RAU23546.1 UDP-N-acetylglucosamine 2-epimerase (hydrolyzing) [Paramagnetospirillum kuznetsovii]
MRSVCVITGSRAEYGLLSPLLGVLEADPDLAVTLVVTGSHLSPRHGLTRREIEADGRSFETVDMALAGDSPLDIARAVGRGVTGMAETLDRLRPDLVVVLGDRYEILAAAQAALLLGIPLAHINGGERTEGAIDDSIRHAVTKMASLHFAAAEPYRTRIIQMGERPDTVFTVGMLGADNARRLDKLTRPALEADLGLSLAGPVALVTYHPTTADARQDEAGVAGMLAALDARPDLAVVITGVNADAGGNAIAERLAAFAESRANTICVDSLGWRRYLSLMAQASVVVGNSSSGVIEAPILGIPTVNIGDRQQGRLRGAGVIDAAPEAAAILAALDRALEPDFRARAAAAPSPFGDGHSAERICAAVKAFPLHTLGKKPFHDL